MSCKNIVAYCPTWKMKVYFFPQFSPCLPYSSLKVIFSCTYSRNKTENMIFILSIKCVINYNCRLAVIKRFLTNDLWVYKEDVMSYQMYLLCQQKYLCALVMQKATHQGYSLELSLWIVECLFSNPQNSKHCRNISEKGLVLHYFIYTYIHTYVTERIVI